MQPEEARTADTRGWLARAALDLRSARHALTASPPLRQDALFHCQQAVEKLFKAFLTWHDVPFRKTHSLEELGSQCLAIETGLRSLVDEAAPLSEYAWKFRYPGPEEPVAREEMEAALRTANTAFAEVLSRLPAKVHPNAQ